MYEYIWANNLDFLSPTVVKRNTLLFTTMGYGYIYCIWVKAKSTAGEGWSTQMCARIPNTPPAPVNVIAFAAADGGADVYWRNPQRTPMPWPEAINQYNVLVFPAGADQYATTTPLMVTVPPGPSQTLMAHVPGLTNGITYTFAVESVSDVGLSVQYEGDAKPSNALTPPRATWHAGPLLPEARGSHFSVAFNSYLHLVSGSNGAWNPQGADLKAHILADGSIGPWEPVPSPPPRYWGAGAIYSPDGSRAFLYMTGGYAPGQPNVSADVLMAPIAADGTVGEWSLVGTLPVSREGHATAVYKNFLYMIGGETESGFGADHRITPVREVSYARLLPDGAISGWMATQPLPMGRWLLAAATYRNHLYAFGGNSDDFSTTNTLFSATLADDGSISGPWTPTMAQPLESHFASMVVDRDRLYIIGGNGGDETNWVQIGAIDPATGDVTSLTNLASDRFYGVQSATSAALWNSTLYLPGGLGVRGSGLSTVQYARLGSDGHVASF